MDDIDARYFEMMEDLSRIAALWSGLRNQFVENGWHPQNAEVATLEIMRHAHR